MPAAQTALVIGGGIAGPVAATALAMAGIEAAVYEARVVRSGVGQRDRRLARARAQRSGCPVDRRRRRRRARRGGPDYPVNDVDRQQARPRDGNTAWTSTASAHRPGALHRILRERAERGGVRIHDAKKLIRVDEHPDSVTAHFADGCSASADVLIGADGVHSTVRRVIDPDAPGARYLGLLGFEGIVDDAIDDPATASLESGTMTFAFGRRAYYLYWKRPDGRIGWGANLQSPQYLSGLARNFGDVFVGARYAAGVRAASSWAAMRSSRAFRSSLVNFHSNGVAICS